MQLRPFPTIGWLLVVAGGILAWLPWQRPDAPRKPNTVQIVPLPARAPRRPSASPPRAKRIDPASAEILAAGSAEFRPATLGRLSSR